MLKVPLRLHVGMTVITAGNLASAKVGAGVPGYRGVFELRFLREHVCIRQYPGL